VVLSPIAALLSGQVDAVLDDWVPQIPREEARNLAKDGSFRIVDSPGSLTVLLDFNRESGPFRDGDARIRLAAAIDREELVREVAAGFAEPRETLFAVPAWPSRRVVPAVAEGERSRIRARLLVHDLDPDHVRLALVLARQVRRAGFEIDVVAAPRPDYLRRVRAGDYDVLVSRTDGMPYDPHMWLVSRFLSADAEAEDPELAAWIRATFLAEGEALAERYREVEARIEAKALLVPLFAPRRLALTRPGVEGIRLGRNAYAADLGSARRLP
jgi:ABC-type oligopeptide transport system substrate-binding subunit